MTQTQPPDHTDIHVVTPVVVHPAPAHGQAHAGAHAHPSDQSHVPTHYPSLTWVKVVVVLLCAGAALGGAYALVMRARHEASAALVAEAKAVADAPIRVAVVRAEPCDATRTLSLPGECRALNEATIFARTSGYLAKVNFDIGDQVKAGELLARIDTPELEAMVLEVKAKIASEKAEILLAQSSAQYAAATLKRYDAAAPEGGVSQQELEQKTYELRAAEAKMAAAKARLGLSEAELKRLETMVQFQKIAAPFSGVITRRYLDAGALITAGSGSSTIPLFRLENVDTIRVKVDVPQRSAVDIATGADVEVLARELPGVKFRGKVERTSRAIDMNTGTLRVEVLVPNPDHKLMPGMYVTADFTVNTSHPAVRIPASALSFKANGPHVATVSADDRVSFRPVKISRDLGDFVEVSDGLAPTDTVGLNISSFVMDGDRVTPVSQDPPASRAKTAGADAAGSVQLSDRSRQ